MSHGLGFEKISVNEVCLYKREFLKNITCNKCVSSITVIKKF